MAEPQFKMKSGPLSCMTVACHGYAISINIKIVCMLCGVTCPSKMNVVSHVIYNRIFQYTSSNRFYSVEVSQALVARLTRVRFTVGPRLLLLFFIS